MIVDRPRANSLLPVESARSLGSNLQQMGCRSIAPCFNERLSSSNVIFVAIDIADKINLPWLPGQTLPRLLR